MDPLSNHALLLRQADWASLLLSIQWIYEGAIPADGTGPRTNPDLGAWLLLEGSVRVRFDAGGSAEAGAGKWVFLPAGPRFQDFSEDARILSLCWRARWPDGRNLFEHGLPVTVPASDHPGLQTAAAELLRFSERYLGNDPQPGWRLRASARIEGARFLEGEILLMKWLGEVFPALAERQVHPSLHDIPDERVLRALELMEYLPLRRAEKPEKIARSVGLSVSQLNRLFSQHMGHTPTAHVQARRLSEARHLLQSGDMPIKEIAFQVGFASQSAFTHWFRKAMGCNPRSFQQQFLHNNTEL
ncbi:MAG: helix-turn-helix transcriptional regulator [Verrucomicrobia bacterium]|nr:helix-turn-helix transcriptional regulator [Verrucomicrobiota bacterium]MCH8526024.1 helix-turn-helix transcriptional regulator [Kiritimatiellia bacterium]